jgi:hypothetical protein
VLALRRVTTEGETTSESDRAIEAPPIVLADASVDGAPRDAARDAASSEGAAGDRVTPTPRASGEFGGLADLDEDLRTMSQSNAEVERWRRLSTRGLTPATGIEREATGPLDPPIVSEEAHTAPTSPGTLEAPTEHASVGSADETRKLPSVRPEMLAALDAAEAARRSFAPPKDMPSAPPGSRVILPRSSHPPGRTSSRPVKVPRPSQPPPDPDAEVRGWRASDPSVEPRDASTMAESQQSAHDDAHAVATVAIPRPAPLPGAKRAAQRAEPESRSARPAMSASSTPPAAPASPPALTRGERPQLDSPLEVSGAMVLVALLAVVALLFGLAYLVLL